MFPYRSTVASITFEESGLDWRGEPAYVVVFVGATPPVPPQELDPADVEAAGPFPTRHQLADVVERRLRESGYSLRRLPPREGAAAIAEWEVSAADP